MFLLVFSSVLELLRFPALDPAPELDFNSFWGFMEIPILQSNPSEKISWNVIAVDVGGGGGGDGGAILLQQVGR